MKFLKDVEVKNKRVLVRCDFNCPLNEAGEIIDDGKIRATIPTIKYLIGEGAKVMLMSHLGKPMGVVPKLRFTGIQKKLSEILGQSIRLASDCVGDEVLRTSKELLAGEILLLENLRFHREEEENDSDFSKQLASLGDIFVNDAFAVCHRKHASIFGITKFLPSYVGLLLQKEIKNLSLFTAGDIKKSSRLMVAVFGGAKTETKLPAIKKMSDIADYILIGGKIGEELRLGEKKVVSLPKNSRCKIILPEDSVSGLDMGEKSIKNFIDIIKKAKMILWNGPLGQFEKEEFSHGTKVVAKAIADAKAFKVVGGGETLFAIARYGLEKKFDFLSTGGGAMLYYLAGDEMPGIDALK